MTIRLTYTGHSGAWTAALRTGRRTLVDCGHSHRDRSDGRDPAINCGTHLVLAARGPRTAAVTYVENALAAADTARRLGARITNAEARANAEAAIAKWREVVISNDFHIPATWSQKRAGRTCGCCRAI